MFSWRAGSGAWEEVQGPFGEAGETPRAGGAQAESHRINKKGVKGSRRWAPCGQELGLRGGRRGQEEEAGSVKAERAVMVGVESPRACLGGIWHWGGSLSFCWLEQG